MGGGEGGQTLNLIKFSKLIETFDTVPNFLTNFNHWELGMLDFFFFQMDGEVFDIYYCILNGKFYIYKQKLFHENALDFYDYLWELKYKLQIEKSDMQWNQ